MTSRTNSLPLRDGDDTSDVEVGGASLLALLQPRPVQTIDIPCNGSDTSHNDGTVPDEDSDGGADCKTRDGDDLKSSNIPSVSPVSGDNVSQPDNGWGAFCHPPILMQHLHRPFRPDCPTQHAATI
jgi:hypothetical protein